MNRKILSLAIPNIVSNITIPLLGMVDMAIVGHLGDDALIGGIGIGTSVFNFIYWNFAFLRMGTSGLTAQSYGARNFPEITAVLVRALSVSLLAAVLLILFREPVGRVGLPDDGRHAAYDGLCGRVFLCADLGRSGDRFAVRVSGMVHRHAELALPDVCFDRDQSGQYTLLSVVRARAGVGYRGRRRGEPSSRSIRGCCCR